MLSYENLLVEIEEKVALITLNRPKSLNALNKALIAELSSILDILKGNKEVKVVILTGSGNKAFVAGADIKEFSDFNSREGEELSRMGQNILFNKIENFPKPVIAAINGFALGGGLELALACHFRFASENAKLGLPEVTLGLIPGYGGTQRLPKLVGKGMASQMIFSAEMISAEKAIKIGLINECFEKEELIEKTKAVAKQITKNSSSAIAKSIETINKSNTEGGFELEIQNFGKLFDSEDFKEGVSAFLERRKPNFS